VPYHEKVLGCGGTAPHINLSTRGEWSVSHPSHFTPRERNSSTHWALEPVWMWWWGKKIPPPARNQNPVV